MAPSVSPSEHVLHPEKTSSVRVPNSSQRADFGDSGLFSYFEIAVLVDQNATLVALEGGGSVTPLHHIKKYIIMLI